MLNILLSLLFPPSAHERTLMSTTALEPNPATVTVQNDTPILTCTRYDSPEVKAAIVLLKKSRSPHAITLLSALLADVLLEESADVLFWDNTQTVIIPIPLSKKQKRIRGFNQVEEVCKKLPSSLSEMLVTNALVRVKHTKAQKSLTRSERFANVSNAFALQNTENLYGKHIVLIDDVTTTGATLSEAARVCRSAGFPVSLIALARA